MKHTVLARSYAGVLQRYDSSGGIIFGTIYTAAELRCFAQRIGRAQVEDLDLLESAYRQGVERAEELCRQVLAGPYQRVTGNKLKCL